MWKFLNLETLKTIFSYIGLLSALLGIARTKFSRGEKVAIFIWSLIALAFLTSLLASATVTVWALGIAAICVIIFLIHPSRILSICRREYRVQVIARRLVRSCPQEDDLERMLDWINRHASTRAATENEIAAIVSDVPALKASGGVSAREMETFRREIFHHELIWSRWHEVNNRPFTFDFDVFRFMNPDSPEFHSGRLIHQMVNDVYNRFSDQRFDTIMYLHRGKYNHRLSELFKKMQIGLPCAEYIGFPVDSNGPKSGSVLTDELLKACRRKSVLLVEPIMIDLALDEAFEKVIECQGVVNGVVIMFEVMGIQPDKLRRHAELLPRSKQQELRGQVVLDLLEHQ